MASAQGKDTTVATDYNSVVYGNNSGSSFSCDYSDPNNNMVTVNAWVTVTGTVIGSYAQDANVTGNKVTVNGAVTVNVLGGESYSANAQGNIVTINGTVGTTVYGGFTANGSASGNSVTINGKVNQNVYGGHGDGATGNFVTVTGKVNGNVYGGGCIYGEPATGAMTGNQITLNGAAVTGDVYGGYNSTGDLVTGNTLNLSGANSAQSIGNFDTVNIVSAKWGTPALTLTGNIGTVNNINTDGVVFSGIDALPAKGENTVLIKNNMTGYTGNITSGKFKVGTTLEGEGTASVSGDDLIYTVDTDSTAARDQTHNTVMGAAVGMAALSVGNDFIGSAMDGLSLASNVGADGVSSFAQMGGGSMRQETGSHVDTHTWNAILALGTKNKKERGTMEYGAFFEYGSGNYTTHADNGLRGDGSARYTGGGLLAKWTANHGFYVEGSLRAGTVHDDARNVLSDGAGNPYSYDTNANYFGGHVGVGKEIPLNNGIWWTSTANIS